MFLQEINLEGFKSFAQKTKIKFDNSLTGFVGPNGSGKSNINDAIKWVLGERSLKQLRSKQGDDVIFNGSPSLAKAKFAEVSLVFDNSKQILNVNYKKVVITRRILRSTRESEFFINKNKVRRKDIRNLVLDTGLGNSSLTIISQGTISKMAEAKPLKIRQFLNEAAGVSKYEIQKSEALRKLEAVQNNLKVVEVIYKETQNQVKPLLNQSIKAKKYLELKKDLEEIELYLIKHKLNLFFKQLEETEVKKKQLKIKKDLTETKIKNLDLNLENLEKQGFDYEKEHNNLNNLKNKVQLQLNQLLDFDANKVNNKKQEKDFKANYDEYEAKINLLEKEEKNLIAEKNDFEKQNNEKSAELNKVEEEINYLNNNLQNKNYYLNLQDAEISKIESKTTNPVLNYVLENKNIFKGILGTVYQFIKIKNSDFKWIDFIIKNELNKLIVINQDIAKNILTFLKENKKGILDILPQKEYRDYVINEQDKIILKNSKGYKGQLLDFISVNKNELEKLISNYLSHWSVFDTYDNAIAAIKLTNARTPIISRDGFLIKRNHFIYGGSEQHDASQDLKNKKALELEINELNKNLEKLKNEFAKLKLENENLYKKSIFVSQKIFSNEEKKETFLLEKDKIARLYKETFGKEIQTGTTKDHKVVKKVKLVAEVEKYSKEINYLSKIKLENTEKILTERKAAKKLSDELYQQLNEYNNHVNEYNNLKNKTDILIDNLNNDYKITYDQLNKKELKVKINLDDAEIKVNKFKSEIDKLGYINFESIETHKILSERYEKIKANYEDVKVSSDKLLKVIKDLDKKNYY